MKLVNGLGVELLAFNVMFTTVGALPSFSNRNSTFKPSLSTAVMGGIVGAPAIIKVRQHFCSCKYNIAVSTLTFLHFKHLLLKKVQSNKYP